jgi:hypothetical protein
MNMNFDAPAQSLSLEDQLAVVRSRLWTPELNKLLRRWKRQIDTRRRGHTNMSQVYSKRHYMLGVPATILTTATSTSTIATFQDCSSVNATSTGWCDSLQWVRLGVGIVGGIAVIFTGILTFMNYQKTAQDHKKAANEYESLFNHIDSILSIPTMLRGSPIDALKYIRDQYDTIVREAPTLDEKYQVYLGFAVAGGDEYQPASRVTIDKLDPGNIQLDDRDLETVKNDKAVLKKIIDTEGIKTDNAPTPRKKSQPAKISPRSLANNIKTQLGDSINRKSSSTELNDEIEIRNNFDSDDDNREVCIAFDIDDMACMGQGPTALAVANLQAQRERQVQESLQRALQFEITRMGGSPRNSPSKNRGGSSPNTQRRNRSRSSQAHTNISESQQTTPLHTPLSLSKVERPSAILVDSLINDVEIEKSNIKVDSVNNNTAEKESTNLRVHVNTESTEEI